MAFSFTQVIECVCVVHRSQAEGWWWGAGEPTDHNGAVNSSMEFQSLRLKIDIIKKDKVFHI